uniref:Ig-like domain-containing protein n=1 Tax=Sphenodon punctatus TaxID=8508 RepID=A0A8D0GPP9_SPHPU
MGTGPRAWGLLALVLLWGAAAAAEDPAYLFSQVLFCEPDSPSLGLSQMLDSDQLFWFDFPGSSWHPRLPDFQSGVPTRPPAPLIENLSSFCKDYLGMLSNIAQRIPMPESKGIPALKITTMQPLELGRRNTLICSVSNVFPASLSVVWEQQGVPVTEGVNTTQPYSTPDLDFFLFSYLEFTPQEGDVYICAVGTPEEGFNNIAFWVPKDPIDAELWQTVLCALGLALGIILMVVGFVLIIKSRRPRN